MTIPESAIRKAASIPIKIQAKGKKPNTVDKDGYKRMHRYQNLKFDEIKDSPFAVNHMSVSGGKSLITMQIAAYRMQKDKQLRVVIAVPKKNIGMSYVGDSKIIQPDGTRIDLAPFNLSYNGLSQKG